MSPRPKLKCFGRLTALTGMLMAATILVIAAIAPALAQDTGLTLVNADRDLVERKKDGRFIARPVFSRELDALYYAIRDADNGDWVTLMYRVQGGEKKLKDGWEYSWEYPALSEQPDLDPGKAYLLVIGVPADAQGGLTSSTPLYPCTSPAGFSTESWRL